MENYFSKCYYLKYRNKGAGKAGKAGKSAIFLNWTGKAGKPVLFSDREAGKTGISTFEILKNFFNSVK